MGMSDVAFGPESGHIVNVPGNVDVHRTTIKNALNTNIQSKFPKRQ
jgi:hypothetical protein